MCELSKIGQNVRFLQDCNQIGHTQNCSSVVALPCRTLVLPAASRLTETILRKPYYLLRTVMQYAFFDDGVLAVMATKEQTLLS